MNPTFRKNARTQEEQDEITLKEVLERNQALKKSYDTLIWYANNDLFNGQKASQAIKEIKQLILK